MAENKLLHDQSFIEGKVELDCTQVSKIFKKIKTKGILDRNITYYMDDYIEPSKELLNSHEFIDAITYYRLLKRKSKTEIAVKSGILCDQYREYEIKKNEIQDWKVAEKIVKALEIEDIVEIPEYFKIMKEYPIDSIKEIIEKIGKKEFSRETNIPVSTINSWSQKNAPKSLSTATYRKMQNFFKNHKIPY